MDNEQTIGRDREPTPSPVVEAPELPSGYAYSVDDLQAVALARYGMAHAQTLAVAQALHQKGLIICRMPPDVRVLPESMRSDMQDVVRGYVLASGSREYDAYYQSPGWVDEVRTVRYIPQHGVTLAPVQFGSLFGLQLSDDETRIYGLVHARILDMFRPAT